MTMESGEAGRRILERNNAQMRKDLQAIREIAANSERLNRDLMRKHFEKQSRRPELRWYDGTSE